eukprot:9080049-Alexandrium_andersonii.AAC.1
MSASLVGSEMCIRDSFRPWLLCNWIGVQSWCLLPPPCRAAEPARCSRPVSYTHLTLPTICSV